MTNLYPESESWIKRLEQVVNVPVHERIAKIMVTGPMETWDTREYYGYSEILYNYVEMAKRNKGHENRQHWYPKMLLKYFKPPTKEITNLSIKPTIEPIKRGVKPFDELFSNVGTWSKEIEAIFTGVETLFSDFIDLRVGEDVSPKKIYDLVKHNEAARISFSLLIIVNLLRNPYVQSNLTYFPSNNKTVSYDALFKDSNHIEFLLDSAIMLSIGGWEYHHSNEHSITFSEELIRLVPQSIEKEKAWYSQAITNSAIYIPIFNNEIITITPQAPENYWKSLEEYHGFDMSGARFDAFVFQLYNLAAFKFGRTLYTTRANAGFDQIIEEFVTRDWLNEPHSSN